MTVRAVETFIEVNAGFFEGKIQWSHTDLEPSSFQTNIVRVGNYGELITTGGEGRILLGSLHFCSLQIIDDGGILLVEPFKGNNTIKGQGNIQNSIYLRCFDKSTFIQLFSSLLFWQNLKPRGVLNKRVIKKFNQKQHNRFSTTLTRDLLVASCKIYGVLPKSKNMEIVRGPEVTIFQDNELSRQEKWFTAMVILKSNGLLELINESDGQSIYCIDITRLTRDEVRELHNSIFQSSNYLFIGKIYQLRKECVMENTLSSFSSENYIISNQLPKVERIILEFPYRIDVDDWLVALKSFTIGHYVGLDNTNLLRVSRTASVNILEASGLNTVQDGTRLYAEIQVWDVPWYRTAIVSTSNKCAFFRECFDLDLPMTTSSFAVVLKKAYQRGYSVNDTVVGHIKINYSEIKDSSFNPRLYLIDDKGESVANMYTTFDKQANYILPPTNFSHFEKMLENLDFAKLLNFINTKNKQQEHHQDLEKTSVLLLDIFQSLSRQKDWFLALIDMEIKKAFVDSQNSPSKLPNGCNLYNSLFRGNSLLTKSIELYNLRVGREYLEKVIGEFVKMVISHNYSTEMDPIRIQEEDPDIKNTILEKNFNVLLKYLDELWFKIYQTSNDLPDQIKQQLSILRKKIELYTNDTTVVLNCITGFIFLRFFCPVLLNPKLFFLTKDHQTGENKRTLTLISKILLGFSNRTEIGAKEPYLTRFNSEFISKHRAQLLDYLDKITLKKLDFSPSILRLSSSLERPDISLPSKDLIKELPTVPFLIDKYLRIDQLVDMVSNQKINPELLDEFGSKEEDEYLMKSSSEDFDGNTEIYKIGSLEFEKLILNENRHIGDIDHVKEKHDEDDSFEFGSDRFIQVLLKTEESDGVFNYINANSSLKDLIAEADRLSSKKARLTAKLSTFETAKDIPNLESFANRILSTTVIDPQKRVLRYASNIGGSKDLKLLNLDSTYNSMKLKFSPSSLETSRSSYNLNRLSQIQDLKKTPTRTLQRMIRSASLNTISSFNKSHPQPLEFTEEPDPKKKSIEIDINTKDILMEKENATEVGIDPTKRRSGLIGWFQRTGK